MIGRRDLAAALALAGVVAIVYLPALSVGFYSDDYQWLGRMNPALERPLYVFSVFYRDFNPLLHVSFLLDWVTGGGSAVPFHAQSILIHAACAAALLLLLRARSVGLPLALAAVATWALNVRISEAVIWPAARGHSLATLCVLGALLAARRPGRFALPLVVLLFGLGLLAKETALFPMLLLPWFSARPWRDLRLYSAVALVAAAFVAFNLLAKPDFHTSSAPMATLALKVPFILLRPLGLGDYYDFSWLAFLAVALVFLALAFALRRTSALEGLLWVAVCTLPLVALDKLSSRYLYMMSVGYALAFAGLVPVVAERLRGALARHVAAGAAAFGLLTVLAANLVFVRREIADYAVLSAPYAACVRALEPLLSDLEPGETVVVADIGPRDAIPVLARTIAERDNMSKLIPYRDHGIGGLIELADLVNTVRRQPGQLGRATDLPASAARLRLVAYDGVRAVSVEALPGEMPEDRSFAVRFDEAGLYFQASSDRGGS